MKSATSATTRAKVTLYEAVAPVFNSVYSEFQELSKKKPDTTVTKAKVAIVNRVLVDIKALVTGYPTAKYLDLLQDEELPQNSDVVLIMSQYVGALANFRDQHFGWDTHSMDNVWSISNS